jgi:hypothetical protein
MRAAGLEVLNEEVISPNILRAILQQQQCVRGLVDRHVPKVARSLFFGVAALEGTLVYNQLVSGELVYLRMALRKA